MSKPRRAERETPACFAVVASGLEAVAADEITRDLGGDVKKAEKGIVVFRVPEIGPELLRLRTVDDVFLLAWGTDSLTYRAEDLKSIRQWTAKEADWQHLLSLHHALRPKPKGKPSYRLVTQMGGTHGYRRIDAGQAMAQGLGGVFPPSWKPAEENAAVEVWLIIRGRTAVCGVRLSDKTMRHRTYKVEHQPASLRPTIAAAMVRLAGAGPLGIVDDNAAPRQAAAADAGRDRVDDRVLRARHDLGRQILIAQGCGIAGQLNRFTGHSCLPHATPRAG